MRLLLWSLRAFGTSRSHDYPNSSPAGFLFPVALCGAFVFAALHGNSCFADWSGADNRRAVVVAIYLWRRGEELAAETHRGTYDSPGGGFAVRFYAFSRAHSVESGNGRVERDS